METTRNRSVLGTLVTWAIVLVGVVIAAKLAFWLLAAVMDIVGFTVGVAAFAIFRVVPVVVVVWLMVKAWKYLTRETSV